MFVRKTNTYIKYNFTVIFLLLSFFVKVNAQEAKLIYDGRFAPKPSSLNPAEQKLWYEKILPSAENYWKDTEDLFYANSGFEPVPCDIKTGSFTKKGAKQKAILYNFKNTGQNAFINGIVIIEKNNVVAHIVYNGDSDNTIGALPDINKNGLNEIIVAGSGQNTGEIWKSIVIVELSKSSVNKLGRMAVYTDNFGSSIRRGKAEASKLLVKPAHTPVFYKELFISKDINTGKNSWNRADDMKQVKLDDDNTEYIFLKK